MAVVENFNLKASAVIRRFGSFEEDQFVKGRQYGNVDITGHVVECNKNLAFR